MQSQRDLLIVGVFCHGENAFRVFQPFFFVSPTVGGEGLRCKQFYAK